MKYEHIANFDPSPYLSTPRLSLPDAVTLAKSLRALTPEDAPAGVQEAAAAVDEVVAEAEAAMVGRLRDAENGPFGATTIDHAIDGVWLFVRQSLVNWAYLEREGLAALDDDEELAGELDLEELREFVALGRELNQRLFGVEGTNWLQRSFTEQAQHMANVLRLIEEDGLGESLAKTVHPEIVPLLRACQRRYEAMVQARLNQPVDTADLRKLRATLQRVINFYSGTVVGMISTGGAAMIEVVETALHPIVSLRERRERGRKGGSEAAEEAEQADAAEAGEDPGESEPAVEPEPEPEPA